MMHRLLSFFKSSLICGLTLIAAHASAQGISDALSIRNIGTIDGLSQNTVRDIVTDHQGFLWFATFDGLNRFDGKDFVVYKPKLGMTNWIDDSQIRSITVDKAGYLWIRKYNFSHSCYNPKRNEFVDIRDTHGELLKLPQSSKCIGNDSTILFFNSYDNAYLFKATENGVRCVWQDTLRYRTAYNDGKNFWLCKSDLICVNGRGEERRFEMKDVTSGRGIMVSDGIVLITDGTPSIRRFDISREKRIPDATIPDNIPIYFIYRLKNSLMVLDCGVAGAKLYDAKKNEFYDLGTIGADYLEGKRISYETDNEGGIWLHGRNGYLYHYDALNNVIRSVKIMSEEILKLVDDPRIEILSDKIEPGVYWITSYGGGLVRYDENTDHTEIIKTNKAVIPEYCLCICQDRSGTIWIGSEFIGAVKIAPKRYESRNVRPGSESVSSRNNVRAIYESVDGNVWLGIKNSDLIVLSPDMKHELFRKKGLKPYVITADSQGRIWVGARGLGIYVFDLTTFAELAHFSHDDNDQNSISSNNIFKIIVDRKKRIWIATFGGGLDLVNEEDLNKVKFQHFFSDNVRQRNNIRDVFEDSDGRVWTATAEGLICFSPDKLVRNPNDYVIYHYDLKDPDGISSRDVRTICEDKNKRKWIGTGGGGLNLLIFDTDHVRFKKYTKHNGLPSDIINSIVCTDDSTLWIGTENGISHFNIQKETFNSIKLTDNLICQLINDHACAIRSNGNILWGSLDGIVDFNPRQRVYGMEKPKPTLTEITANGDEIHFGEDDKLDAAVPFAKQLKLPAGTDNFSITFSSLNLADPNVNEYSYMLEGYDANWCKPTTYTIAEYDHMKPGNYVFKVRNDSDGANKATRLNIRISNHWWATGIAKIIYVLLGIVLITMPVLAILRYRREAAQAEMDREINEYKMRFFSNINNDIQTPLMGVERAVSSLNDQKESLPPATVNQIEILKRDTTTLSDLVRKLLEFRRSKDNDDMPLNLEATNMAPFLDEIFRMFDDLATERQIRYSLNVPGGWTVLLDREKVERVVYCFLSNAFKRTQHGGTINVTANRDDNNNCCISVSDNGSAIPIEMRQVIFNNVFDYTSEEGDLDLAMTKNYAEAHHGSVGYTANVDGGSTFSLTIPIDYSKFADVNIVGLDMVALNDTFPSNNSTTSIAPTQTVKSPTPVVLMVINDIYVRNFLSDRLKSFYNVEATTDTKKANDIIKKNTPDLIVCDANLTHHNVQDFVRQIRQDFNTSHLPIIVIGEEASRLKEEIPTSANVYLDKPYSYKELHSIIKEQLKRSLNLMLDLDSFNGTKDQAGMDNITFQRFSEIVQNNIRRSNFAMGDLTIESRRSLDDIYDEVYKATGFTIGEYIKAYRLATARKLIMSGKLSIVQTYQQVGVIDINYFNKCFMRLYGASLAK